MMKKKNGEKKRDGERVENREKGITVEGMREKERKSEGERKHAER